MSKCLLVVFGILSLSLSLKAQNEEFLPYDNKSYEISGLKVVGNQFSDEKAIIGISGLRVGQKINVPGPDIPNAIKAIYKQRLFTQVEIKITNQVQDVISLEIQVQEKPRYATHSFKGVKKSAHEDLNVIVSNHLPKNSVFTNEIKEALISSLQNFYIEKGYLDTKVEILEFPEDKKPNSIKILFDINKGKRVKISNITFSGNKEVTARKLRKQMKDTKRFWQIFSKSKFLEDKYAVDKDNIINYYNSVGFRNASILGDSIWRASNGKLKIHIDVHEGNRFYFRNIAIKGNSLYPESHIKNVLGIQKGDVYNQELLQKRLSFAQDGRDVSSLYMDEGYLFFKAEPIEVAVENDSVDIEIRITEGPPATIDKVIVRGNERTNEEVIRRELRTRPGQKFSRSDIIRSQRAIMALGFFNPEALGINTPVNPRRGTVDIEYAVEERPSDQLELSAGWSAFGLIGTLGVVFNNFSTRNFFKKSSWSPLPQGDGQKLSLRAQANGRQYQSYNFSFTEPWLGGTRPTSLTIGAIYSRIDNRAFSVNGGLLSIARISGALGSQLTWPDDNFAVSTSLNLERIRLNNYAGFSAGSVNVDNGDFYNISLKSTVVRSTVSEPLFPRSGSRLSLSLQLTPPYSLFRSGWNPDSIGPSEKYRWVEYHKWRIDGEWYLNLVDKLVLAFNAKIGILGYYNSKLKTPPFERFVLGGDGLNNQSFTVTGRDIFALRGYEVEDVKAKTIEEKILIDRNIISTEDATIFNKFTMELRYPLSLNPSATIYGAIWAQGGNSWNSFKDYNPFSLKRSVGVGVRVFLPMFGLLGFDYGIGFDKPWLDPKTTSVKDYAKFSLVLGFEPE
ncbi:MAG: outer membrane protein assembly factor BamA [Saprospiraceae bacterium]|nr:outer membrane protein assembly factor BamA [Saprospiraceae bacterium]